MGGSTQGTVLGFPELGKVYGCVSRIRAEPPLASDGEQPTLLRCCGCSPRLKRSVRCCAYSCEGRRVTSVSTTLKTGVGKRRDLTDTSLYQEVSREQEVYRPTFG